MDTRLRAPLDIGALLTVAGLAAGYATGRYDELPHLELRAAAELAQPVALVTRLTHRVVQTHAADPDDIGRLAALHVRGLDLLDGQATHALNVLVLAVAPDELAPAARDLYLHEEGGPAACWTLDGAFTALRAALAVLSGRPVANAACGPLLAFAAAARLGT